MVDKTHRQIREIKNYAKIENIPIMHDEGINYLTNFVIKHKIKTVLEIGTAIAYSAIMMALVSPKLKIVSIERDEERYLEALKNIKKFDLEDRITLIFSDALTTSIKEKFDLIFIDAAKGQNTNFFNYFETNVKPSGYVITDNMNFHGYVEMPEEDITNKNLRSLVSKIKDYRKFLEEHDGYNTEFLDIGDGLAVSSKKEV